MRTFGGEPNPMGRSPLPYAERVAARFLFGHIELLQFKPTYGQSVRCLRVQVFIGDGNEGIVKRLAMPLDFYAWDEGQSGAVLSQYGYERKRLQSLPWLVCHRT